MRTTHSQAKIPKTIRVLGILVCLPILVYGLLLSVSHVYISGDVAMELFVGDLPYPVWESFESLNLPGLGNPGPIIVERVHAGHAIRNSLFVLGNAALLVLLPLLCLVGGVLATLYGLFGTDWAAFVAGLLMVLLAPLLVIVAVLGLLGFWVGLLIMPSTPAYVVLWLIVGLPFTALGAFVGSAPTRMIIIIIEG